MTEQQQPVLNIIGEKVALGPIRRELLPLYQRWINDLEVVRTLGAPPRPVTAEAEADWFETACRGRVLFAIYEHATLRPIGGTDLRDIDAAQRTATFGLMIGERECWGRGYGTETTALMLDYAFNVMTLHNVMLTVFSNNERAIRAYTRAGFREIGRRRQARRIGRECYDVLYMDCLATEFTYPSLSRTGAAA